jgi:hypothetical protein
MLPEVAVHRDELVQDIFAAKEAAEENSDDDENVIEVAHEEPPAEPRHSLLHPGSTRPQVTRPVDLLLTYRPFPFRGAVVYSVYPSPAARGIGHPGHQLHLWNNRACPVWPQQLPGEQAASGRPGISPNRPVC